jgi:hypothetical protein
MIQVGQAKHPTAVIWHNLQFAHGDGLPCRSLELWQTVGQMQEIRWLGILSAIA